MGFVKLHEEFLSSSIMEEDPVTRLVWLCFLAKTDRDGLVRGTRAFLARLFNVSDEQMDSALETLTSPDPLSKSDVEEGRRIVEDAPQVWRIVNYDYYRQLESLDDKRRKNRERQTRFRERRRSEVDSNADVTSDNANNDIAEAEAEAEADAESVCASPGWSPPPTVVSNPEPPRSHTHSDEDLDWFIEEWNTAVAGTPLSEIRKLSPTMRTQLRGRLRSYSVADICEALARIKTNTFCHGLTGNFKLSASLFLNPPTTGKADHLQRLLENSYTESSKFSSKNSAGQHPASNYNDF